MLANATDINAYLESVKSNYNKLLNDYIKTISDEDPIKWSLLDYLDSINNDSNKCIKRVINNKKILRRTYFRWFSCRRV